MFAAKPFVSFRSVVSLVILCVSLFNVSVVFAKPVDLITASKLADRFVSKLKAGDSHRFQQKGISTKSISAIRPVDLNGQFDVSEGQPAFYLFEIGEGGFVIVAGDDVAYPVLGYSADSHFALDQMPPGLRYWLQSYQNQLSEALKSGAVDSRSVAHLWDEFMVGENEDNFAVGSFLMDTNWSQSPYYNDLCPHDAAAGEKTLTGCVATAMAQIMNYWEYPASGAGDSRFRHDHYGVLSANYGETSYQWNQMPSLLDQSSASSQVSAVATLMYHCGVSVRMDYGVNGSGISDLTLVPDSLVQYFGYPPTVSIVKMDETTLSVWKSTLKNELDKDRPIFYVGYSPDGSGGHAWVCDGYDQADRFHMNWGWQGQGDGFFSVAAFPSYADYSSFQMAIVGIQPESNANSEASLELFEAVQISSNPIQEGQAFSVLTNVVNRGQSPFKGVIAVGVFDQTNRLLAKVGNLYNEQSGLSAGYRYDDSLRFSTSGLSLRPGSFYVSVIYQDHGSSRWLKAGGGAFSNRVSFVVSGQDATLSLYAPLTVGNQSLITQNQGFDLSFNIYNSGSSTFNGDVEIDFYALDGTHQQDIGSIYHYDVVGLGSNFYYNDNRSASVAGVNLNPGEYFVAMTHRADGGNQWNLTGEGAFQNPVRVWVEAGPDQYEPNNGNSVTLVLPDFTDGYSRIVTDKANIHHEADEDYYYMTLPAGFDYEIDARVHDEWNSANGNEYTTDVLWAVSASDGFVGVFDDVMSRPHLLSNGGEVGFLVAGWGNANIGTYDLDMKVWRRPLGSGLNPNNPRNVAMPLYRFHRSDNDSHFFTANESEKNRIVTTLPSRIWSLEGVSQRVLLKQLPGSIPVYRLYNRVAGSHFYTASQVELNAVLTNFSHIFQLDGVAFYVYPGQVTGSVPVYRFYSPGTGSHFFTASESEKDQIIATIPQSKLSYEGIAWFAFK